MAIPGAVPASMGRRLLAFVIDAVAALLVGGAFVAASLLPLLGAAGDPEGLEGALAGLTGPFALLGYGLVLVLALVQWWALGTRGWTIGKYLVQLRAVSPETGRPVGMGRALVRLLVPAAGSLALGVGQLVVYLSPFWDAGGRRQGWHDKAAGTMVFDIGIGLDPTLLGPPDGAVSRRLDALMRDEPSAEEPPRIEVEQPVPALPPVPSAAFLPPIPDTVLPGLDGEDGHGPPGRTGATEDAAAVPDPDPARGDGADGPTVPTAGEDRSTAAESRPWAPRPVFPSMRRDGPTEADGTETLQRRPPAPRAVFPSLHRRSPADDAQQPKDPERPEPSPPPERPEQPEPSHQPRRTEEPEQPTAVAPVPPPMSAPGAPPPPGLISTVPWLRSPEPDRADTAPTPDAAPSSAGTVATPSDPARTPSAAVPPALPDLPDEVEQTRLRPARGRVPEVPGPVPPTATLLMSDGRRVDFRGIALIGRDPTPRPGEDPDLLVRVTDPGRSVSKTHLVVGTDRAGVWVADRNSTNGTVVTLADGQQILCGADQEVRLPEGASVSFGDYGFTVELCEEL